MGQVRLGWVGSGRVHPWVRLGWVGLGWVGSGPVSNMSNKYTMYTQENDYSTTIIHNDKKL